jgi:diguanylate cyclase (GGDEF)-like protein
MTAIALPDILAMLILMGILARLMRRHPGQRVELWLLGLTFVLAETIAVSIYRGTPQLQHSMHVLALDSYVLAAATFSWAAPGIVRTHRRKFPFFLIPAVPMLVLSTLYGLELKALTPYVWITSLSLGPGAVFIAYTWRTRRQIQLGLIGMHLLIWVPMVYLAKFGHLRGMVYWGLCCLYLMAGFSFRRSVHPKRIGGFAIVTGFIAWAACFALHPELRDSRVYAPVLAGFWSMQKFFVTIGMLLVLLEDQTERSEELALHDPLTGLPNRRLFDDRLIHSLERSRRFKTSVGLFVIDLNGFKGVNDSCGHSAGDLVLQETAAQLKARVRSSDTLARLGGDEFCVVMADVEAVDCSRILRDAVRRVELPPDCSATLSASIGYALFPLEAKDVDSLLNLADMRMYQEKRVASVTSPDGQREGAAAEQGAHLR